MCMISSDTRLHNGRNTHTHTHTHMATFTRIHVRIHERQICFDFFCDGASDTTNSFFFYCSKKKNYYTINNFENCTSNGEKKKKKRKRKKIKVSFDRLWSNSAVLIFISFTTPPFSLPSPSPPPPLPSPLLSLPSAVPVRFFTMIYRETFVHPSSE